MKGQVIRFLFLLIAAVFAQTAIGQVNVTVRVLPPYQSRITEYASRPDLMLLTVTNTTGRSQRVQLTASFSGDNGIDVRVRPGYRSPQPIELAGGQALTLNGGDIAMLFDHNQIQYTGISQADFQRGVGLPEGSYQLCVRALDYDTQDPISPDEPVGCTQFAISNVEPPTIIQPFNEQELAFTGGAQAFPITWSTPPGSSPLTQYKVKMVEMIAPRNPNDAMQSATTPPFFEETVTTNMLLYGPQYPQLTPGRQYALMVQAVDPYGTINFRNRGMSEVITFTYGQTSTTGLVGQESKTSADKSDVSSAVEYATNTISGKLSWAFKATEESFRTPRPMVLAGIYKVQSPSFSMATTSSVGEGRAAVHMQQPVGTLANYYLGHNALQASRATALAQADPTLNKNNALTVSAGRLVNVSGVHANMTNSVTSAMLRPEDVISTSGSKVLTFSYETISLDTGTQRYPLSDVVVVIKGIKSNSQQQDTRIVNSDLMQRRTLKSDVEVSGLRTVTTVQPRLQRGAGSSSNFTVSAVAADLGKQQTAQLASALAAEPTTHNSSSTTLATGRSDAAGNFTLQMLHPEYEGENSYEKLVVSVQSPGFEPFEYELPLRALDASEIDLGELTLLARTYRFNPKIHFEAPSAPGIVNPGMRVTVYREAAELDRYPYLRQEGMIEASEKSPITINGRRYTPIAVDSVAAGGDFLSNIEFKMARFFYQGSLYVEIEGLSGNLNKKTTTLRITDPGAGASRMLQVKPEYETRLARPSLSGEVILHAGENMVPISGAVLQVVFNPEDVVTEYVGVLGQMVSNTAVANQATSAVVVQNSALQRINVGTATSAGSGTVTSPSTVAIAAAAATGKVAMPVSISSTASQVGSLVVSQALAGDAGMSEQQLRDKYGPYTVKTDESGQYLIGNLPILKEGANYTVKIVSLPYNYRNMAVTPGKEQVFSAIRGVSETRSFSITPEVFNLVGRVVDGGKKGIPWARVHFKGSSSYFETGESGIFQTSFYEGEHVLVVEKEGYLPFEFPVKLGGSVLDGDTKRKVLEAGRRLTQRQRLSPGEEVTMNIAKPGLWVESVQQTQTVRNAVAAGEVFSPAMFGFASNNALGGGVSVAPQLQGGGLRGGPNLPVYEGATQLSQQQLTHMAFELQIAHTFNMSEYAFSSKQTTDLGDIGPMLPRIGKVRFTVVDKVSGVPVSGATIQLFDTTQVTDAAGRWLYEGFGGTATVTVTPPLEGGLITLQRSIQVDETGKLTEIRLELEQGVRLYGKVTGGGQSLGGARVTVEGRDYLQTTSGADGQYTLFIPVGEQGIRVAKSGYISARANRTLQAGSALELNIDLEDGGGRDISKLLGFDIELDKITKDGSGERWSGRFVNLKAASSIFGNLSTVSLPFANIRVAFDAEGTPTPEGNEVKTDVTNLPLKLFGYLPVILQGDQQISVKGNAQGQGIVEGKLRFDVGQIQGSRGFSFPTQRALYIGLAEAGTDVNAVQVFRSQTGDGSEVNSVRLVSDQAGEVSMNLYGFSLTLNLSASSIGASGMDIVGTIRTPTLGPIASMNVAIEKFSINKELRIQTVKVRATDLPSLKIASWNASLTTLLFNENGFKVGGKLQVSIPQSGESTVEFANLSLGKDALYGGQFSFPGSGLNVYNIVRLTTGGKPLSFGRVGSTQVYSLSGSGKLKFDKLITKEITIPSFQVQTDGRFMLQAPINYSADLTFASFKIKTLTVSTLSGQSPFISVQGEFGVSVPGLKFEVADIRFRAAAGGGSEFSVGTIAGKLEVPVVEASVQVGLANNGFSGGGKLSIPGTPINAEIDFHYYKVSGGVDFGAGFKAGVYIPLGIVEITKIGGGFSYNTANKQFKIEINGAASITGLSSLVNLDPLGLTVESRGVVKGVAGVKIASTFELARAEMELNFPGKFFSVKVDSDIEPMKGIAAARMNSLLRIKWDPNDPYAFVGMRSNLELLGIVKNHSDFALGVNIRNPATRGDDISGYFRKLDADLYGSGNYNFSGAFMSTSTFLGIRKENAVGIDLVLVSGKAWFYSTSEIMALVNFGANDYRFRIAGGLGGGAEGCVGFSKLKGCITLGFETCYKFTGGYRDGPGWFLSGKAAVVGEAGLGCSDVGCNKARFSIIPPCVGAKLCLYGHASFDISARNGISVGVALETKNDGNQCN